MGPELEPEDRARRPFRISRATKAFLASASFFALVGASPVALAEGRDATSEPNVLPEAKRDERRTSADDGGGYAARTRTRERKRREEAPPPDDDDWLTSSGTSRFAERFYDLGLVTGMGGPVAAPGLSDSIGLTGVRVMENHGYLSKILVFTLMAMGMSNQAYVGSTYSGGYRTDYYRSLTPEEQQAQTAALSSAIDAEYVMELNVYTRGLWGFAPGARQAAGFEFYLGGETVVARGQFPAILQIAGAFSYLGVGALFKPGEGPHGSNGSNATDLHYEDYSYWNVGVMLRAQIPINEWIETYVQWDLNILTLFDVGLSKFKNDGNLFTSPLRVGGLVNLTDRAYLRAHASVNVPGFGLGWGSELGVRF
jgi:hypothetical protein